VTKNKAFSPYTRFGLCERDNSQEK